MNKFILFFALIIMSFAIAVGQTTDVPGSEKRPEVVDKSFAQLEKQFNQLRREHKQFEKNVEEQIAQFKTGNEQNLNLFNMQIEQLTKLLGHDVALVSEHVAKQDSLHQKSQKRYKLHFIILYSMLFLSLMGLVFVYVYYAKLIRDYDLFHNKRINELRSEHQTALEGVRTDVIAKIDASVDEMMRELLKFRQETDSFQQVTRNRFDVVELESQKKINDLHEASQKVTKEQQEQLKLIIGNAAMKKDINEISEKFESLHQTLQAEMAAIKKTNSEMNKKLLQLKTAFQKTGVKKTKDTM